MFSKYNCFPWLETICKFPHLHLLLHGSLLLLRNICFNTFIKVFVFLYEWHKKVVSCSGDMDNKQCNNLSWRLHPSRSVTSKIYPYPSPTQQHVSKTLNIIYYLTNERSMISTLRGLKCSLTDTSKHHTRGQWGFQEILGLPPKLLRIKWRLASYRRTLH